MLSWSSEHNGDTVDLGSIASGEGLAGEHAEVLWRFASACGQRDDAELAAARQAVVDAVDEAFMVDAAAVAANFEMMTRLADSTGSRLSPSHVEQMALTAGAMGVADTVSRR